jgi:16S rRNA U516 pseudouridylate synthase RsuA-like enzyme
LTIEQGSAPTKGVGGRKLTLNDYLEELTNEHKPEGRLSAVGRLDKDTSGLLLLSDDGILSERALRPGGGCTKVYEAMREPSAPCEPPSADGAMSERRVTGGMR